MKKLTNLMLGCLAGIALAACSQKPDQPGLNPDGEMVRIQLEAPEALQLTRSIPGTNSAQGGLTNVDWSQYDLRYLLAVYSADGSELLTRQSKTYDTYSSAVFELRLTPNNSYKFVAWADFVAEGEDEDLHYNTTDLANITLKSYEDGRQNQINDESRDAYFATKVINVTQTFDEPLTLKRPFAKIRIVTTDWEGDNKGVVKPDNFKVTYHDCTRFAGFNALTGDAIGETTADGTTVYTATLATDGANGKFYEGGYDASANNRTLLVDYLIAAPDQQAIHFNLEMLNGTTPIGSSPRDFTTEIPIQRNYLTTILGNLLSVGGTMQISIDESFTNEWIEGEEWWNSQSITPKEPAYDEATKTYTINTREEFAWLPDHITEMVATKVNENWVSKGVTFQLMNDIDMSGVEWKPIYPAGSALTYTFEGNGHTLRNFSMSGAFGAIYEYTLWGFVVGRYEAYTGVWGKFDGIMRNLTFENITINGLAHADFPVKDVNGEPVDHNKEYAYFAGCIGYTGGNHWSMDSKFENVHAKHVQIKSSASSQNLGGLVGWVGSGGGSTGNRVAAFKDCSATDIHMSGYQAGGLVGQVLGDRGVSFDNCKTEDIYIRYSSIMSSSGFIGNIGDGGINISWYATIEINNCTPAQHVYYINDRTGEPNTTYQPQSPYYGHKNLKGNAEFPDGDKVVITPAETTEP
ncbi:DUF6562 domain-containing protein [Millionella massiliensis]|uniref:DUF6562 domain-containing protein n=1 Tax=Millionella massiliensis TaxID=1871023 RepID=UPI0023A80C84|nr:DUF6562 domain-containing protein [Millionella massiliensis]